MPSFVASFDVAPSAHTKTCNKWKKRSEMQTLRAGCSKVESKIFAPPQTPFLWARDGQNLIRWRCHYLYLQTQFGEDRCTQFRVIVVTDPPTNAQTNPQTHRQDRLQYTVPQLSAQCNKMLSAAAASAFV